MPHVLILVSVALKRQNVDLRMLEVSTNGDVVLPQQILPPELTRDSILSNVPLEEQQCHRGGMGPQA